MAKRQLEELLDLVTNIPIGLQLKTTSTVIKLIARRLRSTPYVFPYTPLLGENLVRIIESVSQLRILDEEELNAIRLLAAFRLE